MWTRGALKDKAKKALDKNYWKAVLVAWMVTCVAGGMASNLSFESGLDSFLENSGISSFYKWGVQHYASLTGMVASADMDGIFTGGIAIIIIGIFLFLLALIIVVVIGFAAIIFNPLDVGVRRFFVKALNEKAEVKEVAFGFDHNYKNIVKILFFQDLKVLGWTMLFIIPGIVKAYEYYMIPYLLSENPNLTKEEAFRYSKEMMTGNKWKTFVLDLSFLGWDILSAMTAGILNTFFVQPYKSLTYAALYEELSTINGNPARAAMMSGMETPYEAPAYDSEDVPAIEAVPAIEETPMKEESIAETSAETEETPKLGEDEI